MLTDTELITAMIGAPAGWTTQTTLLVIGRAIETAVLEKQGQLLREAQMAAAPHFTENSRSECAGRCQWCGQRGPGFADSERGGNGPTRLALLSSCRRCSPAQAAKILAAASVKGDGNAQG